MHRWAVQLWHHLAARCPDPQHGRVMIIPESSNEWMTHQDNVKNVQKMLAGYIMSRVCLRWDYFFRLPFCIYRVACVELAHSSLGDWKNIFITHLIIIIKSEVSTFPIVVIFFRGCVSEMVVLSYSVIYYIYFPGKLGLCFHFWCSVYGICKRSDTLWPVGRVRLFADYIISLSSLCRLIWRHWTTKMLVRYMLPSVCLRLRQFSQLSFIQYMGLCVFSLPISPVMIVRMCTLSYYHHQTGSMNH